MTTPLWSLFVAILLPYVWGGVASAYRKKQLGTLDNQDPRAQSAQLTGPGARAYAAQANAWEALAVFAPAVLVAHLGAPHSTLSPTLALVWVACRIAHGVAYVANIDKLRSALFGIAFLAALGLLLHGGGVI